MALLRTHQANVHQLFARYQRVLPDPNKKALVAEICTALSVHEQIKEEIFYPEVKSALKALALPRRDTVAGGPVKELIAQLHGIEPHGATYDAKVQVLSEYVKRDMWTERHVLFPKVTASAVDMVDLGARMAARKDDLLARAA